jgi:UDP-N-acetylmuramoyl-tripeptide--D-alanyl-D-alanine ligase
MVLVAGVALKEVLDAARGELRGDLHAATLFERVELDAGNVRPGDLFFAVPGERLDGHELVPMAALRGAVAAVVARRWERNVRELALPFIVVDEPVVALQQLAAARRERLELTVVGVTGSVGKTSTKEVVAAVLAERFATYRSPGNRNNELGLPLSLLEMEAGTEVAVLEMGGAYAPGELELLARIAKPTIAVVTNVQPVHLERMGTIDAIAESKAEVVEALPPDGIAILNGDDPRVRGMAGRCRGAVLMYGLAAGNDVRAEAVASRGLDGCSFWVDVSGSRRHLEVPLVGDHAVELVLAALAVGHAKGMPLDEMVPGLADPAIQIRVRRVPGLNGSLLLDDTYNASTSSVLSGLTLLEESGAARRIAVLGDMLELGSLSEQEHRLVGRRAAEAVDLLATYGDLAAWIADEAIATRTGDAPEIARFRLDERTKLVEYVSVRLRRGDVVLLKGSRSLHMEEFVDALAPGSRD